MRFVALGLATSRPAILAVGLFLTPGISGAATFGNFGDLGETSSHAAAFLLGETIDVEQRFRVEQLGLITRSAGYGVQIGLFEDDGGVPGGLVVELAPTQIEFAGRSEFDVAPTELEPGEYWFMALYERDAMVAFSRSGGTVAWQIERYGDPLLGAFDSGVPRVQFYEGQDFNYYLSGTIVPEPSSALLISLGLAGLARRNAAHRRNRRRATCSSCPM